MSTEYVTLKPIGNGSHSNCGSELFLSQLRDIAMLDSWNPRFTDPGPLWNRLPFLPKLAPPAHSIPPPSSSAAPPPPPAPPLPLSHSEFSRNDENNESSAEPHPDCTSLSSSWTRTPSPPPPPLPPCPLLRDENATGNKPITSQSPLRYSVTGLPPASISLGLVCTGTDTHLVPRSPWLHACTGCNQAILESHCLSLSDGRLWHAHCLICSHCTKPLHKQTSCFYREGQIYCKEDYRRLFGSFKPAAICAACWQPVTAQDVIMRALRAIYHYSCFACHHCQRILQPGDRYTVHQGRLVCHQDWCQSFVMESRVDHHEPVESPLTNVFNHSPDPNSCDMKPDFDASETTRQVAFTLRPCATDDAVKTQQSYGTTISEIPVGQSDTEASFSLPYPIRNKIENGLEEGLPIPFREHSYLDSFVAPNMDPCEENRIGGMLKITHSTDGQAGSASICSPAAMSNQQLEVPNHINDFSLNKLEFHGNLCQSNRVENHPYFPLSGSMLFGPPPPPPPIQLLPPSDNGFHPTVIPYHQHFSHSPGPLSHLISQACDIPNLSYSSFISTGANMLMPSSTTMSSTPPLNVPPSSIQQPPPALLKLIDSNPMLYGNSNPGSLLLHQQHQQQKRNRKRRAGLHQAFDNVCLTSASGYCVGLSQRQKRMRTSFKHHQLRAMKAYFNMNHNPDVKDLKVLTEKTGLSKRVLQVWFQNARAKYRRSLLRQDTANGHSNNITNNTNSTNAPNNNSNNNNNINSGTQPNGIARSSTGSTSDIALLPNSLSDCESKSPQFDLTETGSSQMSPGPDRSSFYHDPSKEFTDDSEFASDMPNSSYRFITPSDESRVGMFCGPISPHQSPSGSSSVSLTNPFMSSQRPPCSPNATFTLLSSSCRPRDLCPLGSIHG